MRASNVKRESLEPEHDTKRSNSWTSVQTIPIAFFLVFFAIVCFVSISPKRAISQTEFFEEEEGNENVIHRVYRIHETYSYDYFFLDVVFLTGIQRRIVHYRPL